MNKISFEKQSLIDEAGRHGFTVTAKQIDRWRADHVLPPAGKAGGGRARGVQRPAPEGSAAQLVRLCQFLAEDRSLDRAAFRLWIEDYPIPLARLRRALAHLVPDPQLVLGASEQQIRDKAEKYSEGVRRRKNVKLHVRKMAEDGRLAMMLEGFLGIGLGRAIPPQDQQKLSADFEELSGLNRARTDHWQGQPPWLTGDTTEEFAVAASLLETITPNLAKTASKEEYAKAKEAFKGLLTLRKCAALLQQMHGPNVFGFGVLTDLPIGMPMMYADPGAFLGMLALRQRHPDIFENTVQLSRTLEATLEMLRQQVEKRAQQGAS